MMMLESEEWEDMDKLDKKHRKKNEHQINTCIKSVQTS